MTSKLGGVTVIKVTVDMMDSLFTQDPTALAYKRMKKKIESCREAGAQIGEHVRLWGNIDFVNPHLVIIGDRTCIGAETYLITHCPVNPGPCIIGHDVWIGFRCCVLPNVTVGDNTLIGAGSVVTHNIPANSVAAGNPATVIGSRDPEELKRTIELIIKDKPVGKVLR
jgi:acetyltransferase-like isoleucine patch superfamily enzyme